MLSMRYFASVFGNPKKGLKINSIAVQLAVGKVCGIG